MTHSWIIIITWCVSHVSIYQITYIMNLCFRIVNGKENKISDIYGLRGLWNFETGFVTCSKKMGTILHFLWVKSKIEWYQKLTKRITFYHVILESDLCCPIIHVHVSNYFSCNIWFVFYSSCFGRGFIHWLCDIVTKGGSFTQYLIH
jgi:hypothetical protein